MPKTAQIETINFIDYKTGELKESTEAVSINYGSEPDFIKLYLNTIMYLEDMPQGISNVLMCILKRIPYMDEEDQSVYLPSEVKKRIAKKIGKSEQYVSDSITALIKGKILFRVGSKHSTCYQVNPHIFGRGHWKDIKKLQLHINFESTGTTFWTEVQNFGKEEERPQSLADCLTAKSTESQS